LSSRYWAPQTTKGHEDFNAAIIEDIYDNDLVGDGISVRKKVMLLEFSQVNKIQILRKSH
jgi:hypothetical protein